ncbi:MAG: DUF937 domain-containing protein [Spirochaetes bacterium]|nr:DUF937 domain-containing protein [Spirochaetota bacterium]
MGLIEELAGSLLKSQTVSGRSSKSTGKNETMSMLIGVAIGMIIKYGLPSIVQKLSKSGLKKQVDSWIGTGDNKRVDPKQLTKALGPEMINEMSKKTGLKKTEVENSLSEILPEIINKLTPKGEVNENEVKNQTKGLDLGNVVDFLGKFFK